MSNKPMTDEQKAKKLGGLVDGEWVGDHVGERAPASSAAIARRDQELLDDVERLHPLAGADTMQKLIWRLRDRLVAIRSAPSADLAALLQPIIDEMRALAHGITAIHDNDLLEWADKLEAIASGRRP